MKNFFLSVPHSGEIIPEDCSWLKNLDSKVQLQDLDRFVDQLYMPVVEKLGIPFVVAQVSRYVVDLNRSPEDVEALSVLGAVNDLGSFSKKGLHWVQTTRGEILLAKPHLPEFHKQLVGKYFEPWHKEVSTTYTELSKASSQKDVYQLDCHSMPSQPTKAHADFGKIRPEIVISDYHGSSASKAFSGIVLNSFKREFDRVNYNDPYVGGGITRHYGKPEEGRHCIQIEIRRDLYMDEETKEIKPKEFGDLQAQLNRCVENIYVKL